jgi:hypothetical protein
VQEEIAVQHRLPFEDHAGIVGIVGYKLAGEEVSGEQRPKAHQPAEQRQQLP